MRTIAPIVRSGGARVRTGGAGGVAVSSGVASELSARTRRHRILTWPMVVAALLAGVVLAVASVPVAAVAARLHMNSQSSFSDPDWEGDLDRGDHVELIRRRSWIGQTSFGSFWVPKPVPPRWETSLVGWIDSYQDPRPAFARMPYPGTVWMVDHSATGWPWRAAAGRMFNDPGVTPIQKELLIEVSFRSTFFRIPLRPIWPGLLANTLFYAALVLTPMVLLRWRRTRRRRARGLCVACGYELGVGVGEGVAVCPECGLGRDRDSAAGNRQSAKT